MKCLILAAGYATRLYPLTENFPKPLLKVGDKTILDWLVDDIDTAGLVDTYVVISNHKFAHHFEDWAATKKQNIQVVDDGTSSNETRLGAVCDVQFAIDQLGLDDDMLVIAGDNVLDFSLSKFVAYANEKKTSCIMRYYEPSEKKLTKCGVVELDNQDKILITPLEAMACGCLVVGTNVGFVQDIGVHKGNMMISEPGNIEQMIQNIEKLIVDKALQKSIQNEMKNVIMTLDWEKSVEKLEKIFSQQEG